MDSIYLTFDRTTWRTFRQDTPLTLSETDLLKLKGQNESVSLLEVEEVYLPLARLLSLYVSATQSLHGVTSQFLGNVTAKVPYVVGIAGSVAVGKSTTARILKALLERCCHKRVTLLTTDGFLYPTPTLKKKHLMRKKGFPESYDVRRLGRFLFDLKSGKSGLKVPVYSHHHYDIVPGAYITVDRPDILILEGLNILQVPQINTSRKTDWVVSDFLDFSLYVDAQIADIRSWFLARFMLFRDKAKQDPGAYFYPFATWPAQKAYYFANDVWKTINERNLLENILPFKHRARLILQKRADHAVGKINLRKS